LKVARELTMTRASARDVTGVAVIGTPILHREGAAFF
jgi:hypothetical protein